MTSERATKALAELEALAADCIAVAVTATQPAPATKPAAPPRTAPPASKAKPKSALTSRALDDSGTTAEKPHRAR
jgi:hypothetical protein